MGITVEVGLGGNFDPYAIEGYGYQTTGGAGGTTIHVTNLNGDYSSGSFLAALNTTGARTIVFDVGGTITQAGPHYVTSGYGDLTIDGTTAPSPGITIRSDGASHGALVFENVSNVIIKGIRLLGYGGEDDGDLLAIDGDVGECSNFVVSHCTLDSASDGALDIVGDCHDITVQWCFIINTLLAQLIKYGTQQRITLHKNVYAQNYERVPLIWADVELTDVDFINNIVYEWGQFGMGIDHGGDVTGGGRVDINIVNNVFEPGGTGDDTVAIAYTLFGSPAENGSGHQGDVVPSGSNMGELWIAGNVLPTANEDEWSTVYSERTTPSAAQVTRLLASELKAQILPYVGTSPRTVAEQNLIDEIDGAI